MTGQLGEALLVGIFVGGHSTRMGQPKGMMPAPGTGGLSLVERLRDELSTATGGAPLVLVGAHPAYAELAWPTLPDAAQEKGPLGGLVSLLRAGSERGASAVLAVACDLPYLKSGLVERILQADPDYDLVCARQDGRFQPLMSRYSVSLVGSFQRALEEERLALQPLVREAHHLALDLSAEEQQQLRDWDTPEDVVGASNYS